MSINTPGLPWRAISLGLSRAGNSERWGCRATSGVCLNLNYIVTQGNVVSSPYPQIILAWLDWQCDRWCLRVLILAACDRRWPQLGDRRRLLQPGNQSDRRACSGIRGNGRHAPTLDSSSSVWPLFSSLPLYSLRVCACAYRRVGMCWCAWVTVAAYRRVGACEGPCP